MTGLQDPMLRAAAEGITDQMVERAARALYEQGYGYDIDADEVARNSMLSVARHTLAAAFDETQERQA